jgi:hypothetical protein
MAITSFNYNFVKKHNSLSQNFNKNNNNTLKSKAKSCSQITPAMAANIIRRPMTFDELLRTPLPCQ